VLISTAAEKRNAIEGALGEHDVEAELNIEHELEENSPYPEVRAAVRATDEDVPANTLRAWILGMIFVTIGSGCNMLFSLRNPAIQITSIVAQLVSYPFGLMMAAWLPTKKFKTFGVEWSFNPGPFNMKEHALITIMSNVSFAQGAAYSTYSLESLIGFYNVDYGWGFALLFTITTQMVGLGLAGIFRRFLVYPASMIWPTTLPNCALFYSLHDKTPSDPAETNGWTISRYRYFLYVFIGSFVWYWFPGFIWQGLSVFAFVTWIKPNNVVINQVFGGFSGMSLIPITFDWTYVTAYILSPLIPPWHAIANTLIGLVIFIWVASPAVHYTNTWYAKWLPMSDSTSYDNTGTKYNVSRIITPEYTLDAQKYAEYSPLFLSTTFALTYGLSFASIISVMVHTYLYHGKEIWYRMKAARNQEDDVHMKLMKKYKEVRLAAYLSTPFTNHSLGPGLVVFSHIRCDGCSVLRMRAPLADPSDLVGAHYCLSHLLCLDCATGNGAGDHEYSDWLERVYRVHCWLHAPRPPIGYDELQDLRLHCYVSGLDLYPRS
jgi:OPT family small oligopeptide transporter